MMADAALVNSAILRQVLRITGSAPLMLAFSNLSRAGSYLLPVPLLYWYCGATTAAFWLLAVTLIGMQNLLFLGAPQIFVRILAVARAGGRQSEGSGTVLSEAAICRLMRTVFNGASLVITLITATAGTLAVAKVVAQSANPQDLWAAWFVVVLGSPLRVLLLSRLTFLNGRGDIAKPRCADGLAWSLGGLFAAAAVWLSGSLLAMTLAAQAPIVILCLWLLRRCRHAHWDVLVHQREAGAMSAAFREVWAPTWRAGLGILLSLGARQGAGVLLAQYATAEETGAYLLALNGIAVLMMLTATPLQSALHGMSTHYARSETQAHIDVAAKARSQSLWIVAFLTGAIALAIPMLGLLPVHRAFVSLRVWTELTIGLFVQRYAAAHLQHYTITNRVVWHWLDGATGVINIALCLVLIPRMHGEGAALANLLSLLPVYAWVPTVLAVRHFAMQWPRADRGIVGPALAGTTLFVIAGLIAGGFR
ncbi:MAG: hypothetical protein WCL10_19065 [Novosphingobium sp.]|uniref:hypothetical protein n=1 Tax=Novosphingobium sp. TaxID=1874826 RepID=UPI00301936A5